eukprot:CAMPEP_0178482616 /NCGR_PEP_ID=MMETSP0696-20121128/6818_1 /TAXON_ID=265572 /ORGANISM="Extubocellulus spinifer, Strain CCMP396" /LENGTH=32 /DNA_ID= /DNA_START= /DNA_END= /DNA_ORIENTATION=
MTPPFPLGLADLVPFVGANQHLEGLGFEVGDG